MSVELVARFLEWRAAGDIAACVSLVAPDAVWHSPVGPSLHGPAGFRRALEDAYAETRWFSTETLGVQERGGAIAGKVRNRGERSGVQLDSLQLLVFEVRDGLIADVRIHVDDPVAVAEFWSD